MAKLLNNARYSNVKVVKKLYFCAMPTPPVSFTNAALTELLRLQASLNIGENQALRAGIKSAEGPETSFLLGFDTISEQDIVYQSEGLKVVIHKAHNMYIAGMTIDFEPEFGFSFNRPVV